MASLVNRAGRLTGRQTFRPETLTCPQHFSNSRPLNGQNGWLMYMQSQRFTIAHLVIFTGWRMQEKFLAQ